ncbi:hypothetical protein IWW39_003380 [Coemansia spiralis]|uniref:Uncharacterized protein n=1 Tax=Coemansia spiralis TaxID=417178 RepID=A0A9W8GE18_9FUNG|nr:hypothetical protein IWW39_003380 [Coemansia spiralis]
MADNSTVVADCSAQQYCTRPGAVLNYNQPFVVHWNNQLPPLNPESLVSIAVYSTYDVNKPVFQQTGVSNTNGQATLTPSAAWFSRYTGDIPSIGQNQQMYFAVYLQGNNVPAIASMLQLELTATDAQYQVIQNILHPPPTTSTTTSTTHSPTTTSTTHTSSSAASSVQPSSTTHVSSALSTAASSIDYEESELSSSTHTGAGPRASDGLSGGQITGIVLGSLALLLLLLLLLLLPMYRRRQRRRRMLTKSAALAPAAPASQADSGHAADSQAGGEKPLAPRGLDKAASDTPLLLFGGRPNNSFTSQDGASIGLDSQASPPPAHMQPLSLDSPRILMSMPPSTRSAKDPILSTDDARQIGDIFRDALRKPPPPASEDGNASDSPAGLRESMLLRELDDDQLEGDDDPGWRERVASERMQRELQQEASVIRSVALRAHGSDYSSSSRPDTPRSTASRLI